MYTQRNIEHSVVQVAKNFAAVFIGGPRRAGKTTLSKHIFKNYKYVLLDELDIRTYAAQDPRGFLDENSPPVIIDEIQNVPELFSYIKARIDKENKSGQWILTGSQQWSQMKGISESLAGRVAILHLYPFDLNETTDSSKVKSIAQWGKITGQVDGQSFVISTSEHIGSVAKGIRNNHYSLL